LVESGGKVIDGVNDSVDGIKLAGVEIGEDFVGGESVGGIKRKIGNVGFDGEATW
jgi:hypothetical protein